MNPKKEKKQKKSKSRPGLWCTGSTGSKKRSTAEVQIQEGGPARSKNAVVSGLWPKKKKKNKGRKAPKTSNGRKVGAKGENRSPKAPVRRGGPAQTLKTEARTFGLVGARSSGSCFGDFFKGLKTRKKKIGGTNFQAKGDTLLRPNPKTRDVTGENKGVGPTATEAPEWACENSTRKKESPGDLTEIPNRGPSTLSMEEPPRAFGRNEQARWTPRREKPNRQVFGPAKKRVVGVQDWGNGGGERRGFLAHKSVTKGEKTRKKRPNRKKGYDQTREGPTRQPGEQGEGASKKKASEKGTDKKNISPPGEGTFLHKKGGGTGRTPETRIGAPLKDQGGPWETETRESRLGGT